ncbi:MAG: YraN family protein [Phycisphaerales bacterium]
MRSWGRPTSRGAIRRSIASIARFVRRLLPRRVVPRDRGERAAARELARRGWDVLAANVVIGHDEADLVCRDPRGQPVLVEVKSGRGGAMPAELQVGTRKQAALRRLALRLARDPAFGFDRPPRIDVVVVRLGERDRVERHLVDAVGDGAYGDASRRRHVRRHLQ